MRRLFASLIALAACSGGGGSTGPTPVASVTLTGPIATLTVGQQTTLTATALSAAGTALTGRTVSWSSSATQVATVLNGLVTAVAAGSVTITATVEGKSAQTNLTVVASASGCTGVTPVTVAVGEVRTLTGAERQQLCLSAGSSGGEYVLVPFNSATAATNVPLQLASTNTIAASAPPALGANASRGDLDYAFGVPVTNPLNAAFEQRLRQSERSALSGALRSRSRGAFQRSSLLAPGAPNTINGLGATPAIGTGVRLNTNAFDACSNAQLRGGRVAAVSNAAIVVVDSAAPAGGFTDAEYQSIAVTFDTLIYSLDTTAFGKPFDMDGNNRVLLFFTNAVNQLTPASSTGGFIGGFFYSRDLFPAVANSVVPFACPSTNAGEMFYLPVVDVNSQFNRFFADKAKVLAQNSGTLVHEFQHLINASRRIYVTVADVDFEDTWLNEAMSHTAEELLYYRAAGLAPKQDLTLSIVTSSQARLDAINNFQVGNLGRLSNYLLATDVNAPYSPQDSLATRGASWQLLRYVLDLMPNNQNTYLRALVDAPTQGIPNFNLQFGSVFSTITVAVRQQVIAQFFDNTTVAIDPKYAFPSWNFRNVLPGLSGNAGQFPLRTKSLVQGTNATFSLTGGGCGYARFHVNGNTVAGITPTSGGGAVPAGVELILIRTQ